MENYTIIQAGERLDTLADRLYDDPYQYLRILEANPDLDIWDPEPGMLIEVPHA